MTQQINLFNPAFEEQRSLLSFRGTVVGWAAVAVLVAAFAAYAQLSVRSMAKQESEEAARVAAAQAEMQHLAGQVSARHRNSQVAAEIARLESQLHDRQQVLDVLHAGELGNTKGFSEYLRAFARQSFEGVWLTGLRIAAGGEDVALEGRASRAEHVPGYLRRLNGERAMQGHPFSELVIQVPKSDPGEKAPAPAYVEFRLATKPDAKAAAKVGTQ